MALDDRRALPVARAPLRRSRLAGLGVLAAAVVGLIASPPGRGEPPADHAAPPPGSRFDVVRLDRLLDTGRLFELRDAVRGMSPTRLSTLSSTAASSQATSTGSTTPSGS